MMSTGTDVWPGRPGQLRLHDAAGVIRSERLRLRPKSCDDFG